MLYIIIVLYNEKINSRYSYLENIQLKYHIIFVDNSTDLKILEYNKNQEAKDFTYIVSNGNIGLSKAYNLAIKYIENHFGLNKNLWIMTLDDDTYLSREYLLELSSILPHSQYDLITGIVEDQSKTILSPLKYKYKIIRSFISISGFYTDLICINSGMVIRSSLFKEMKYDEDLFLDMVDYKFFHDLSVINKNKVYVINGKIKQTFSGKDYSNYQNTMNRYKIYARDFITYSKKIKKSKLIMYFSLYKRKFLIRLRYFLSKRSMK